MTEGKEHREPLQIPEKKSESNLVTVTVVCPSCRNLNRRAQRACRFCDQTGTVKKHVTRDELPDDLGPMVSYPRVVETKTIGNQTKVWSRQLNG